MARQGVDLLVTLSAWVGGLGLAAGLGVVLYDVIARAFGHPLSGSPDIVQMCFVVIVFGCVPLCERTAGNVRLDLLETLFPPALNRVFDLIATVGFYSVLGYLLMSYDTPIDTAIAEEMAERPLTPEG